MPDALTGAERLETFACFGSTCSLLVRGEPTAAGDAVAQARARLMGWHQQFSRFEPDSELQRVNADARETVPASPMLLALADAITAAGALSGGLVDATLVDAIEQAGYTGHLDGPALPLAQALTLAPARRAAAPRAEPGWRTLRTDWRAGTLTRPPGVKLDSGGIAKGLFADTLARELAVLPSFAVDCAGDIRFGGSAGLARAVQVASPFGDEHLHTFTLREGAVATSGIGNRLWLGDRGDPVHHLLDPATGMSAYTGLVQVTALAPTAVTAEVLAKAALLAGPDTAPRWLRGGGVLVFDDGTHRVLEPRPLDASDIEATGVSRPAPMLKPHRRDPTWSQP